MNFDNITFGMGAMQQISDLALPEHSNFASKAALPRIRDVWQSQADFLRSQSHYCLLLSGIGYGKTLIGAEKAISMIKRFPQTRGCIAACTYPQLRHSVWTKLKDRLEAHGLTYKMRWHEHTLTIKYAGFEVIVDMISLDNPDAYRGAEIGWFWLDEAAYMRPEAWKMMIGRKRCRKIPEIFSQGFLTTTPNGFNWVYDVFGKTEDPNCELIRGRTIDNLALSETYIQALLSQYDDQTRKQELNGEFVLLGNGTVFYKFNRNFHVIPKYTVNRYLPLLCAIDFNVTPFCAFLAQEDRGLYTIFKQFRLLNANTREMCREILIYAKDLLMKNRIIEVYPDPASRSRNTAAEFTDLEQLNQAFGEENVFCKSRVYQRSSAEKLNHLIGQGCFRITENCPDIRTSFETTRWKEGSDFKILKGRDSEEHYTDAARYMIDYRHPDIAFGVGYGRRN